MLAESALRAPEMGPPPVPITFAQADLIDFNLDITGKMFTSGSPEPPTVPGVFPAACEAARLYYKVQIYNQTPHGGIGRDADLHQRREFFAELSNLDLTLSPRLQYKENPAPGTMFLK
jgi:hypothetical protein